MIRQRTKLRCCHSLATHVIAWLLLLASAQEVRGSEIGGLLMSLAGDAAHAIQHRIGNEGLAHSGHPSLLHLRSDMSASASIGGSPVRHAARLLSARSPTVVRQCFWDPESSSCDADDAVNIMYAVHSRPVSTYLWFLLMTYDRDAACGTHRTASTCRGDTANRCIFFDDVLTVIGAKTDTLPSNNSSSSSGNSSGAGSSKQPESSTVMESSSLGSAEASLMSSNTDQVTAASVAYATDSTAQQPAAVNRQQLKQQLNQRLQQQQQDLQELLNQQVAPDSQQQSLSWQMSSKADAQDSSSGTENTSSTGAADYSMLATAAAPTSAKQANNTSKTAASAVNRRTTARGAVRRDVVCTSRDLLENYVFTQSAYSNPLQAPLAMHCPGSKASDLVKCMRLLGPAVCKSHAECVFVPGSAADQRPDMCVSSYFHKLTPQQVKQFTYDVAMAEPAAVGVCDGACWMRQAMLCNRTKTTADCRALSFCRSSSRRTCTPRLYTTDNFGSSVQEYMGECADVDNKRDCESLRLRLVNKGTYAGWHMPKTPTQRCPVPSIGRLLGSNVVQERGSRLIAAAGAVEEQAAECQAAAAAAAAAANAAQLVSGRGPVVLRQIYFRDSRS